MNFSIDGYRILKILKSNENGAVLLVEHEGLNTRRILKCISRTNPDYFRLVAEARTLQRFRNEAIPIVYDIWDEDGYTVFSEEFIEGETLKNFLNRKSAITQSEILSFSIQLCEILIYIHNPAHRVLHLDLKPENIVVSDYKMKLLDFGSAICRSNEKEPVEIFGTPPFCAPEQMTGGMLTPATDVWALGKIFEYMLLYAPVAPTGYKRVINCCLRKSGCFSNASEVKQALQKLRCGRGKRYEEGHWLAVAGIPTDYHSSDLAFGLAYRLSKKKSVLLLDVNGKRNLEHLEEYAEKENEPQQYSFSLKNITVAKRVLPEDVKGWRGRGYDYVICDFGQTSPKAADVPFEKVFLTGSLTPWTLSMWENALREENDHDSVVVCVTEGSSELLRNCLKKCSVIEGRPLHALRDVTRCISRL